MPQDRTLWMIANDQQEADRLRTHYEARGAKVACSDEGDRIDVLVTLAPESAEGVLGYQPDEEEWLEVK